ncbi:hypothetical protein BCR36DRAFT_581111, partial [Piromyces finnis]
MEDEQIKKKNKYYSSPLQNLDSSESDTIQKKQEKQKISHLRERSSSPTRKKKDKDKKKTEELKPIIVSPPSPRYNNLNHNNTIYNQTFQYSNDYKKNDYISPPQSPVPVLSNDDVNKNHKKKKNKNLTENRKKESKDEKQKQNNVKKGRKNKELINNNVKVTTEKLNDKRNIKKDIKVDNISSSPIDKNYDRKFYCSSPIKCQSQKQSNKINNINTDFCNNEKHWYNSTTNPNRFHEGIFKHKESKKKH